MLTLLLYGICCTSSVSLDSPLTSSGGSSMSSSMSQPPPSSFPVPSSPKPSWASMKPSKKEKNEEGRV